MNPLTPKFIYSDTMCYLNFQSDLGHNSTWINAYDSNGTIIPFVYNVNIAGKDVIGGTYFAIDLLVNTMKEPTPYGLSTLNGMMTFWGQANTSAYFQTGLATNGSVTYQGLTEDVIGTIGHIDRQWFPWYPGILTPDGREHSHEWRQINLEGGLDLAIWRQFDRTKGNELINTTGITTDPPDDPNGRSSSAIYADDIEVEYISYAKWPRSTFPTIDPAPSPNMWLPSSHIIRVPSLGLELSCTYFIPVPAVRMPIEYFEGPATWQGTFNGSAISGVGIFESTLGLYHDWELAQVLTNSVSHLPSTSFASASSQNATIAIVDGINKYLFYGESDSDRKSGLYYIYNDIVPALPNITSSADLAYITDIVDDLEAAINTAL